METFLEIRLLAAETALSLEDSLSTTSSLTL